MQVDLAGSERIKESGSEGMRLTEAQVHFYFVTDGFYFILSQMIAGNVYRPSPGLL